MFALMLATLIATAPAAAKDHVKPPAQLVVIGDSNVEGRAVRPEERYPAQLQAALRHDGYNIAISNKGIYGDRIQNVLRRLNRDVPSGTTLAIVWAGINDARRGATPSQIDRGHAMVMQRLRARGIPGVLIVPPAYDLSLHRNRATRVSFIDPHMNARGYSIMVQRTYRQIELALRKAGIKKSSKRHRDRNR